MKSTSIEGDKASTLHERHIGNIETFVTVLGYISMPT